MFHPGAAGSKFKTFPNWLLITVLTFGSPSKEKISIWKVKYYSSTSSSLGWKIPVYCSNHLWFYICTEWKWPPILWQACLNVILLIYISSLNLFFLETKSPNFWSTHRSHLGICLPSISHAWEKLKLWEPFMFWVV